MEIPVSYAGFEGRRLLVKANFVSGPSLWVDGAQVKKEGGSCLVRDNQGRPIEVKLKSTVFDPIPKLQIGSEIVPLAEPLKPYEYVWSALPLVLIFIGGALGGGLGGAAAYLNLRVFRTDYPYGLKYVITAAISGAALVSFLILATLIAVALKRG